MDDGQIVAQGQHEELIQTCRLYQSLYETQLVKANGDRPDPDTSCET